MLDLLEIILELMFEFLVHLISRGILEAWNWIVDRLV